MNFTLGFSKKTSSGRDFGYDESWGIFDAFVDAASSAEQVQKVYDVWSGAMEIDNLRLAENDYI